MDWYLGSIFQQNQRWTTRILAWMDWVLTNSSNDYSFLKPHFELFETKLLDYYLLFKTHHG